jgi:hypothetical protein
VSAGQPLVSRWTSARLAFRRGGPAVLFSRLVSRCLLPLGTWQVLVFFEKDLASAVPAIAAAVPLDMHVVTAEGLPAHRAALEAAGIDWDKVAARAALGHRCTVVLSEGRLVHVRWMTGTEAFIPELRATLRPLPGEAYVYDAFTPEDARGGRIQPAVSRLMTAWSRRQGYLRHVFYVRGHNASGLRIVSKIGARRTAVVRSLRLRWSDAAWVTGLRRGRPPRLEFDAATRVRSLGPLGHWISRSRP